MALSVFFAGSSLAYADEVETTEEEAVTEEETTTEEVKGEEVVEETMCIDYGCGGGGYWGSGIYISASATESVKATEIYFYASYEITGQSSKTAATTKLQSEYVNIKNKLEEYGTVKRTGMYTYTDWYDPSKTAGSLSVSVQLDNVTDYSAVEDLLYTEGFSPWADIRVKSLADVEASVAAELRELLDQKEETYSTILGYALGSISSLSLYSWVDSYTFDAETGMVDVTVTADAWYYSAE